MLIYWSPDAQTTEGNDSAVHRSGWLQYKQPCQIVFAFQDGAVRISRIRDGGEQAAAVLRKLSMKLGEDEGKEH